MADSEAKKRYYDSDAKIRWDKENVVMFSVKFFNTPASDKDIIDYFNTHVTPERSKSKIIKEALREKMEREKAAE